MGNCPMPSSLWYLISDANREDLRDPQQSRIELYRAVTNPAHMNASMIPDFYENIQDNGLDSLETFVDADSFRCKYEDPFSQREFLQQCHNLTTSNLSVTLATRTVDSHVVASYEGIPIMSHHEARSQLPDDGDSDDYDDEDDRRISWLDGCRALDLELKNFESYVPNSFTCPCKTSSGLSADLPSGDTQSQILPSLRHPRLGSKLKTINIKGSWVTSEDALVTLLMVYAPYLTELYVESIDLLPPRLTRDTGHGGWILQRPLDALKSSRGLDDRWEGESTGGVEVGTTLMAKSATAPGDTLRLFTCGYVLSRSKRKSLALHGISNKDMKKYRDAGILVVSMRGQFYVRKDDRMNC
ncbi:hypothetical protein BG006_005848 [Podila minutissima]|uniref:Uncharacterized protein n=1 Tax=Podila minutissima TaxID=64525 RepID=A0A9P5SJC9_9FUNG|nr:hypothetical protein BG006_005848 [Podila minutissima]